MALHSSAGGADIYITRNVTQGGGLGWLEEAYNGPVGGLYRGLDPQTSKRNSLQHLRADSRKLGGPQVDD